MRMERPAEQTFMYYLSHDSAGKKIFIFYKTTGTWKVGNGKTFRVLIFIWCMKVLSIFYSEKPEYKYLKKEK